MLRKNVAGQFIYIQGVDATTGGIKSGVTWTMRRCLDGTFAAGGATITEDGTAGWYKIALAQADTNGNDIGYNFTGTGAIPVTVNVITTAADPTDGVRFGLTAIPNVAQGNAGQLPTADSSGRVTVITNSDKTGYALTAAYDAAKTAAQAGNQMDLVNAPNATALAAAADALLNRDMSVGTDSGSSTVRTVRQALRFLRNKWAIAAGALTVYKEDDSTASWTGTVTTDGSALPITGEDPAGP